MNLLRCDLLSERHFHVPASVAGQSRAGLDPSEKLLQPYVGCFSYDARAYDPPSSESVGWASAPRDDLRWLLNDTVLAKNGFTFTSAFAPLVGLSAAGAPGIRLPVLLADALLPTCCTAIPRCVPYGCDVSTVQRCFMTG